ncbi:polysaccharide deacetylase family protein [Chryseolinea lacunae]|uniref:Polysaccharide deacetylase family protein n=1 Tax=Chryseolinea lacunae TaxID=2801331 RepID=A0ABS1KM90_9BACT|nr:polysaccharide deacetylase family protein [Chryseolinea lacunae]MBL0740438.1 polysaccharide deacetylase family protein [Chryseolinea lacunae]
MTTRRNFLKNTGVAGAAGLLLVQGAAARGVGAHADREVGKKFWPEGARLVISVSMQFEAGGQPANAESPFPQNMQAGYRDLPAETWYAYGYEEGIPRMLDLWDKFGIKVTSHMVGEAVLKNPALAKEIVLRGHEAAAHGMRWSTQYAMSREEEKKFIDDGVQAVKHATGATPVGYNANWLRRGENTLAILQELGFRYHIDDLSRDEPFVTTVNGKPFAVVPYTIRCNDILLVEGKNFSADQFLNQLKLEFDQLYDEAAVKRRQMSISFHDRIGGSPAMVAAAKQFFQYALKQKGVVFKRKDEIAKWILAEGK